jgi:predicted transcriptional regulator
MNLKRLRRWFFANRWDVAEAMEQEEWCFAIDLCRDHGFSIGAIYVHLMALEKDGYVESRWIDGPKPRRREYRRTAKRRADPCRFSVGCYREMRKKP